MRDNEASHVVIDGVYREKVTEFNYLRQTLSFEKGMEKELLVRKEKVEMMMDIEGNN